LPPHPLAALKLVDEGERVRLDTGRIGDEAFLLMASTGLDSLVAGRVGGAFKQYLGPLAYAGRAAMELCRYRGLEAEVRIDGERSCGRILGLVAGNTRSYGGVLQITSQARADDGLLDVCLYHGSGRKRFLRALLATLRGRHVDEPSVTYRKARQIELLTDARWPVQADGEVVAQTPVTIACDPRSVTVVVPQQARHEIWDGYSQNGAG
jgi:diacylglycerol kinase family enzyme